MYGNNLMKDYEAMGSKYLTKYMSNKFSSEIKNAVYSYVSGTLTSINLFLRNKRITPEIGQVIQLMDKAFIYKWDKDLYRVIEWDMLEDLYGISKDNIQDNIGRTIYDKAYMSTTKLFNSPWNDSYLSNELIIHIYNSKEVSCIDVNKVFKRSEIDCYDQQEIILPRNTGLKIIGYHKEYNEPNKYEKYDFNGTYVLECKLITSEDAILEKYGFHNIINENDSNEAATNKIKYIVAKTLQKLEEQKRFQDAKLFAEKVKKLWKSSPRLRAVLYGILFIILTIKVFKVDDVQKMANGQYEENGSKIECVVEDDGNIDIEEIEDNEIIDENVYAEDFKLSEAGKEFIKSFEKLSLEPYYASKKEKQKGIRTIGYGHVIKKNDPEWLRKATSITKRQAEQIFEEDVAYFEKEARRLLLKNKNGICAPSYYTQGFMDAFISMIFNSGVGNVMGSTFYKTLMKCRLDKDTDKINSEDYNYTIRFVPNTLIYSGKEISAGLQARRMEEYKQMILK